MTVTEIELGVSVIANHETEDLLQFHLDDPVMEPIGEKPSDNAIKQNPKGGS